MCAYVLVSINHCSWQCQAPQYLEIPSLYPAQSSTPIPETQSPIKICSCVHKIIMFIKLLLFPKTFGKMDLKVPILKPKLKHFQPPWRKYALIKSTSNPLHEELGRNQHPWVIWASMSQLPCTGGHPFPAVNGWPHSPATIPILAIYWFVFFEKIPCRLMSKEEFIFCTPKNLSLAQMPLPCLSYRIWLMWFLSIHLKACYF